MTALVSVWQHGVVVALFVIAGFAAIVVWLVVSERRDDADRLATQERHLFNAPPGETGWCAPGRTVFAVGGTWHVTRHVPHHRIPGAVQVWGLPAD